MKKTLTKSEIKSKAKSLEKRLRKIYNELDNLSDEADIAATEMGAPDKPSFQLRKSNFETMSHIIGSARDHTEMAYDTLQTV